MESFRLLILFLMMVCACTPQNQDEINIYGVHTPNPIWTTDGVVPSTDHPPAEETLFRDTLTGSRDADRGMEVTQTVQIDAHRCLDLEVLGLAAGDIDGDGNVDVVLPNCDEVLFLAGNGDGTLEDAQVIHLPNAEEVAFAIYLFDFDKDGRLDILRLGTTGPTAYRNESGVLFRPFPDNLGIPPRVGLPMSASFIDMNLDGYTDIMIGYSSKNFAWLAGGDESDIHLAEDDEQSQDMLLLGSSDGTFAEVLLPSTERGQALHVLPTNEGIIVFNDFGESRNGVVGRNSALYTWTPEGVVATPMHETFGYVEAPMGGMYDDVLESDGNPEIAVSDTKPMCLFQEWGGTWFDAAQAVGLTVDVERPISWSVLSEDVNLDGHTDIIVSYSDFPVVRERFDTEYSGFEGVNLFTSQVLSGTFRGNTVLPEIGAPSTILADLNGDGLRELIAREINHLSTHLDPTRSIVVLSGSARAPRAELVFDDPSCYGGRVDVEGAMQRRILPYGNSGSFGHGTPSITFPVPDEGTEAVVSDVYGGIQEIPLVPNERVQVSCLP